MYELATFCRDQERKFPGSTIEHLTLLSLKWDNPFSPLKKSRMTEEEKKWFNDFSCVKVQCSKPSDRATVLGEIRRNWCKTTYNDDSAEDRRCHDYSGIVAFDEYVRGEGDNKGASLIEIFEISKARYARQTGRVMGEQLELAFGGQ